jgi:hypothetical protein
MAKNQTPSGRSKVRIFFVDADLAPGDMQELTSALTNAIRPTHMIPRVAPARLSSGAADGNGAVDAAEEAEFEEVLNGDDEETPSTQTRGPSKPRKYRSPKAIFDLDVTGGDKPFAEFAKEKGSPKETADRYLVAAYWLAEHANLPTVSVDHIFTCYRAAGWTFDVQDPGAPFRYFKKVGLGDTKSGKLTIGHLGRARVEKMNTAEG